MLTKKDNASYSKEASNYQMEAGLVSALFYAVASSPDDLKELVDDVEEYTETKYYSTGEKNLSVKITVNVPKEGQEKLEQEDPDEEFPVSGTVTATYNDFKLKSINENVTTNLGNKGTLKGNASYNKFSISLPSGWEQLIPAE